MLYLYLYAKSLLQPREEGQGLVEYVLILALIAIVAIALMAMVGDQIKVAFANVVTALGGTPPAE